MFLIFSFLQQKILSILGSELFKGIDFKKGLIKFVLIVLACLGLYAYGFYSSKTHWQKPLNEKIAEYEKSETNLTNQLISIRSDAEKSIAVAKNGTRSHQKESG